MDTNRKGARAQLADVMRIHGEPAWLAVLEAVAAPYGAELALGYEHSHAARSVATFRVTAQTEGQAWGYHEEPSDAARAVVEWWTSSGHYVRYDLILWGEQRTWVIDLVTLGDEDSEWFYPELIAALGMDAEDAMTRVQAPERPVVDSLGVVS